ncbi:endonuclease/exonuclease/phosphatase family protein [Pararhodobacter zhoushanensis]|uniref:Endonuclease/exonuclease/phosphatase family protein n=1 Tax=Pararhodobacter zhoushanensis TaxID=2479545 RepID=A0ABT3GVB6_9RHOB|nr:endonuclease/exonuclease/phosphatase family protein [Pararhodobacter zhoushanensis]MCW1931477.1 endonuclease/exonuclease/phosphatase family protein [Pararhodobacter zhoushanensis]
MLRDIRRTEPDILAARDALVALNPDAVLLLDVDHDRDLLAVSAFATLLSDAGLPLLHHYAPRPNTGLATGLDLDGDGRRGEADDAQGWGRFAGAGGMALLSRHPIVTATDHSAFLWRDLPASRYPHVGGQPFPSAQAFALQRLASTGLWDVTLDTPQGPLTLLAWHAGPPVFGGPHQRNHWRNADETAFWRWRLDGGLSPVPEPFVLLGDANLDPAAGAGERGDIAALLAHPRLQDPLSGQPTAHWPDGPGALRVDYVLPSAVLRRRDSGLVWPTPDATHAIVWVDLDLPAP